MLARVHAPTLLLLVVVVVVVLLLLLLLLLQAHLFRQCKRCWMEA